MKLFGDTINQLIQRENDRLTVHHKRKPKVKRNKKARGPRPTSALTSSTTSMISNTANDLSRFGSLTATNPSLLPPNPALNSSTSLPQTATRHANAPMATKKKDNSSIAGLSTPTSSTGYPTGGVLSAPNGTSQFSNVHMGQYLVTESNVPKPPPPPQTQKTVTPMTGISAGLTGRGTGKGSRASGGAGTGQKRLV